MNDNYINGSGSNIHDKLKGNLDKETRYKATVVKKKKKKTSGTKTYLKN